MKRPPVTCSWAFHSGTISFGQCERPGTVTLVYKHLAKDRTYSRKKRKLCQYHFEDYEMIGRHQKGPQ